MLRLKDFPYPEPRPGQLELIEELTELLLSPRGRLVVEGYNGMGKTVAVLYALKESGERAVIAVRTYEEAGNYMVEARRLGYPLATVLSKRAFCPNDLVSSLPDDSFYAACRRLSSSGRCPYASRRCELNPRRAPDLPTLVEELRRAGLCPFLATLRAAYRSRAVVVTYPFVFGPATRVDELFPGWCENLVIDEGHNIVYEMMRSAAVLLPEELESIAKSFRGREREILKAVARHASKRKRIPQHILPEVLEEAAQILGVDGVELRGRWIVLRRSFSLPRHSRLVIMSGFIPRTVAEIFGGSVKRIEPPPDLRIPVFYVEGLTSRLGERERFAEAFRAWVSSFERLPGRKAVFFASAKLMEMVLGEVRKPPRVVERPSDTSYTLYDVAGGRLSEGSNVPLDAVLVVGMPFPEPSPSLRIALDTLSRGRGKDFAWRLYEDLALCRLVQILGRLTRGWSRRPFAIVLDERVARYRDRLPRWVDLRQLPSESMLHRIALSA